MAQEKTTKTQIKTSAEYFKKEFKKEIAENIELANRKTGFANIDEKQIFNAGLYVVGATPACGKTTFCWQLLNQLAENGESCIYCSYEMSRLELYSKSVSSKLFQRVGETALTAADIRRGVWNTTVNEIVEELQKPLELKVIELSTETIDDLLELLKALIKKSKRPPIVCVDYLQIIPSEKEGIKQSIDDIVHKLKIFQRQTNTTFIIVSSFNRTNYNLPAYFESFKESGSIEYSADVIWAMQPKFLNEIVRKTATNEIRERMAMHNQQTPREIQIKCLKNRNGNLYDVYFNYYSAHDYFESTEDEEDYYISRRRRMKYDNDYCD